MGNFMAYPKSHLKVSELINGQSSLKFRNMMEKGCDLGIEPKHIHAKTGDVLFAHPLLAHDIAPNSSDKIRWAVIFRPVPFQQVEQRKKLLNAE